MDLTEPVLRAIQAQLGELQRAVATLTESQAHTASRTLRIEHRLTEIQIETETMIRMELIGRIGALNHHLDERFNAVDERLNGIETRLDGLERAGAGTRR